MTRKLKSKFGWPKLGFPAELAHMLLLYCSAVELSVNLSAFVVTVVVSNNIMCAYLANLPDFCQKARC